jgi:hypothetical protein
MLFLGIKTDGVVAEHEGNFFPLTKCTLKNNSKSAFKVIYYPPLPKNRPPRFDNGWIGFGL